MLKLIVFSCLLALISAGNSPHGEEFLAKLSQKERDAIPKELLEDAILDVPGLINKYGYINETYDVKTEDGYIVTLHRIAGKRGVNIEGPRKVAFLMHGLMGSSSNWIINGPGQGLGYILSDLGYDVWMGNARGTYYSRKHPTLNPDTSRKYWMFSWDQIGRYDLPASIDFVLEKTGEEKLHYIGHSQGTTTFFVMTSERPEYNKKIITMHSLATIAYQGNAANPMLKLLSKYMNSLEYILLLLGRNEFLPQRQFYANFGHKYCSPDSKYVDFCIMGLFGNDNLDAANASMIPLYLSHGPAGASSRQFVHFTQGFVSAKFRNYDYGFIGNMLVYGSLAPKNYPVKKITAPVALYYSDADNAVDEVDVLRLAGEVKNCIGAFRVPRPTFGHLDYVWALDVKEQVYDGMFALMKEYEEKDKAGSKV